MPSITLSSLRQSTYDRLENNTRAYSVQQVDTAIGEAISVLNLHCGWIQETLDIGQHGVTIANRPIYNLPERIIYPTHVFYNARVLRRTTLTDTLNLHPKALVDNTAARFGSIEQWCPIGVSKILVWPAASVAGQSLQVSGVVSPEPLVDAGDVMELPNESAASVADYAAHRVQFKLGGIPFNQSSSYYANFQTYLKARNQWKGLDFPTWKIERQVQKQPT